MAAEWLVYFLGAYLAAGLVFAVPFIVRGVDRIDPAARLSRWGFRIVILPGAVALWPILFRRWRRSES